MPIGLHPPVKPFGEEIRKPGAGDGVGCCGNVVFDTKNFRGVQCRVDHTERRFFRSLTQS